jgi:hypothetical protein
MEDLDERSPLVETQTLFETSELKRRQAVLHFSPVKGNVSRSLCFELDPALAADLHVNLRWTAWEPCRLEVYDGLFYVRSSKSASKAMLADRLSFVDDEQLELPEQRDQQSPDIECGVVEDAVSSKFFKLYTPTAVVLFRARDSQERALIVEQVKAELQRFVGEELWKEKEEACKHLQPYLIEQRIKEWTTAQTLNESLVESGLMDSGALTVNRGKIEGWCLLDLSPNAPELPGSRRVSLDPPAPRNEFPMIPGFFKYYCVFTDHSLYYFKDELQVRPEGFLSVQNCSLSLNLKLLQMGYWALDIATPVRHVVLILPHLGSLSLWIATMEHFLSSGKSPSIEFIRVLRVTRFYLKSLLG